VAELCYGLLLKKIRRRKDVKAATLAHCLGISPSAYSRIETGQSRMTFEKIATICDALGLTVSQFDELLEQDNEKIITGGQIYEKKNR